MKTISINNLLWDTENLEKNGETYFSHDEALEVAKAAGKRLSTKEELRGLAKLGSTWDSELKGRWFGVDSKLKEKSEKSVFFPALGYRRDGMLRTFGELGHYWSGSVDNASYVYALFFDNRRAPLADSYLRTLGFSVRCVR
jgi:hypothetical protein